MLGAVPASAAGETPSNLVHVPVLADAPVLTGDTGWGDAAHAMIANTPQQSTFNYQAGHYGDGWIVVIDRIAGVRLAKRATLSLEAYSTQWRGDGTRDNQWLDRANVIFDVDRQTSFSIGARTTTSSSCTATRTR